jgi:zinc transporter ZupT
VGTRLFTGLAAGILLGTCFLSLLPEVMEQLPASGPILIVGGFFAVFLAENFFGHQAHAHLGMPAHGKDPGTHELVGEFDPEEPRITAVASWIALGGLAVHAFFDGVAIAATWSAGVATGLVTFLAVVLHKVPEGFSISAILQAAAFSRRGAFLGAAALAMLTVLGAAITLGAEEREPAISSMLLGFAAGSLLYVVTSDLLPVVHRTGGRSAPIMVGAGVVLVYAVMTLARAVGTDG